MRPLERLKNGFAGLDGLSLPAKLVTMAAAVVIALLIGVVFILFLGKDPLEAYYYLLIRPFTARSLVGEITIKLVPLLIIGLGVSFTFQAKLNNLGGQGQLLFGAVGMTLAGVPPAGEALGGWSIVAGILLGACLGAAWAGIAGLFKTYFKASEIITTLLLNYIAVQWISYLVYYPLRDPNGNIPQSAKVAATLPKLISGSRMNAGVLIAALCVAIYWIVIKRTGFGYNLRVLGGSTKAAEYGGIGRNRYYMFAFLISGAFAGTAGAIEIAGTQTRLIEGMAGSYGFDGLVVSLLGLLDPVGVVVASVFMAALSVGVETMQVKMGIPSTFLNILEALIVLFILLGFSLSDTGLGRRRRKPRDGGE